MEELVGQSFIANIYANSAQYTGPITATRLGDPGDDAWWVHREAAEPLLTVRFEYASHTEQRTGYRLVAGPEAMEYEGATLGLSDGRYLGFDGGYLGFYRHVEAPALWHAEWLGGSLDEDQLHFTLHDQEGRQVAIVQEPHVPLHDQDTREADDALVIGKGEPVQFRAVIIERL